MVEHLNSPDWDDLTEGTQEVMSAVAGDFVEMLGRATSSKHRAFYARVSLMGHRSIGLCRVTEAPLAGVTMLRCEKDGGVEWVNPAVVYSVTEVPSATAEAEIAIASKRGLLLLHDSALQAALRANGLDGFSLSPLDDVAHDPIGFSFYTITPDADAERLVDAMRDLGFASVNVRPAVDCDELVESIPF